MYLIVLVFGNLYFTR